jgi:hypothetical protein
VFEVETQFAYDKLADIPTNTVEPAHEQDTDLPFTYNNSHAEEERESSIYKDWNIIVEEDESEDDITNNEEQDKFDAEPVLIKVKSYNLPVFDSGWSISWACLIRDGPYRGLVGSGMVDIMDLFDPEWSILGAYLIRDGPYRGLVWSKMARILGLFDPG